MKPYLNLGCGERHHEAWVNVDFKSSGEAVMACDLRQGIPFPDGTFRMVYHSHVLEHFGREQGVAFLRECYRVLAPGGILRVVVPDLEKLATAYLHQLARARQGEAGADFAHEFSTVFLLDQMVRTRPGGQLAKLVATETEPANVALMRREIGAAEYDRARRGPVQIRETPEPGANRSLFEKIWRCLSSPAITRRVILQRLLGASGVEALALGRFRSSGEVHQWMYDSHALGQLLRSCGFEAVRQCRGSESALPEWAGFHLDTEPDGTLYKPDSLYLEGTK